jgi:hypothetical protein
MTQRNAIRTPEQIAAEMDAYDALPSEWRAFAQEYGMGRALAFAREGHSAASAFTAIRRDYEDFLEEVVFFLS